MHARNVFPGFPLFTLRNPFSPTAMLDFSLGAYEDRARGLTRRRKSVHLGKMMEFASGLDSSERERERWLYAL